MMNNRKSHGRPKEHYWTMRSDKPRTLQSVTSGTVYWTPMSCDAITHIFKSTGNVRFKFQQRVINNGAPGAGSWSCTLYLGAYRFIKGTGGSADTLTKWGSMSLAWSGLGDLAATNRYDGTGAVITSSNVPQQLNLPDGTYMLAMMWVYSSTKIGSSHFVIAYGADVSTGNWLYVDSGLTGQASLPNTVASLGSPIQWQPLLIWEN